MEIKVNIPKNDYVQPKEVRTKVVQDMCNHIIYWMNNSFEKGFYTMRICDHLDSNAEVHIFYDSSAMTKTSGVVTSKIDKRRYPFSMKVRTCEMKAVFKAIQKAGYHIFAFHCITNNEHSYVFTTKPVLNGHVAKKIDFSLFID